MRQAIARETELCSPPLCPELFFHLITPRCRLWRAGEAEVAALGWSDPFWAFAWPGGQALARFLLDQPDRVRGRRVLDFGAGCGSSALAAARGGARDVLATEIDPLAICALEMNAEVNALDLRAENLDILQTPPVEPYDLILAGDVCYGATLSETVLDALAREAARGSEVLLADPSRGFFDPGAHGLVEVAAYPAPRDIDPEGQDLVRTAIYRFAR